MLSENLPNGDFEGFGIAILEANYLGLPAIGSKNSGIADAISNGYSGILVDPHNPTEIAEAIMIIMSDYSTYSKQARKHASNFLWKQKVQEYLSLLD
jgi:glycosyltransferase involved in cell wall biosynthesis